MKISPFSIAICGYGTAAQACALLLRAQSHGITVFERGPLRAPACCER